MTGDPDHNIHDDIARELQAIQDQRAADRLPPLDNDTIRTLAVAAYRRRSEKHLVPQNPVIATGTSDGT